MDLLGRSPKTYPPTGAKCSTARRYESELRDRSPSRGTLDHSQRPRRYEGHFASTGTRNSKVRTLLFLRIRRGNLLTFGICWTILCDFLESRKLLMDFWDYTWRLFGFKETFSRCWDYNSHPFVNGFVGSSSQAWDYTWRLFRLKETFSRFWDYTLHPFVNGFVGSSSQADYLMRNAAMDDSIGGS
jgi:hypothetical protein